MDGAARGSETDASHESLNAFGGKPTNIQVTELLLFFSRPLDLKRDPSLQPYSRFALVTTVVFFTGIGEDRFTGMGCARSRHSAAASPLSDLTPKTIAFARREHSTAHSADDYLRLLPGGL